MKNALNQCAFVAARIIFVCIATLSLALSAVGESSHVQRLEDAVRFASEMSGIQEGVRENIGTVDDAVNLKALRGEVFIRKFLSKSISDTVFWVVTFDSVDIRPQTAIDMGADQWELRNIECVIEPSTGALITIRTHPGEPPPNEELNQWLSERMTDLELYTLIDSSSTVTFIDAVTHIPYCSPLVATSIEAYLIKKVNSNGERRAYWYLFTFGVSVQSFGDGQPQDGLVSLCIIDAVTGDWISGEATTTGAR